MSRRSLRSSLPKTAHETPETSNSVSTSIVKKTKSESTPRKSPHFVNRRVKQDSETEDDATSEDNVSEAAGEEASGYEDEDASAVSSPSADEEEQESDASETSEPARKKPRTDQANKGPSSTKGKELWRSGVKTGLGPGKQVIIAKPKARPAGKTPYTDDSIHPNTMLFLSDLARNNDREWLKMNDPDYRIALKDFHSFTDALQQKMIELDPTIPELPLRDIIFRIYRDVRFSPDKTPYKTYFSAAWSRTGRKGPFAAYYVQIKPGASFVGGGLWMPEARHLAAIRRDIDRNPHKILNILGKPNIRKDFLNNVKDNKAQIRKAFAAHNAESALKTKPKGYDASHEQIELLRLRSFAIGRKFPKDSELTGSSEALKRLAQALEQLVPFVLYLNSVVMPDDHDEHGSGDDQAESSSGSNDDAGNSE